MMHLGCLGWRRQNFNKHLLLTSPAFIEELSSVFGSQAIVVSIETGIVDGKYQVLTENGRNRTNIEPVAWAKECEERGAGEIILTSIPHEGMGNGLNNLLISEVCNTVTVPVLAGGVWAWRAYKRSHPVDRSLRNSQLVPYTLRNVNTRDKKSNNL